MDEKQEYQTLIINSARYKTLYSYKFANRKKYEPPNMNLIMAFMPGTIIDIMVKKGKKVKMGQPLLVLEAMKMHNTVLMPFDGAIKAIHVKKGEKISKEKVMIEIEPAEKAKGAD